MLTKPCDSISRGFLYLQYKYTKKRSNNDAKHTASWGGSPLPQITLAFYGTVPSIIVMIFSQYLIKVIYAAVDTPFFYLLTRRQ